MSKFKVFVGPILDVHNRIAGVLGVSLLALSAGAITEAELATARAEWKSFTASFEPDYSDGASLLGPASGNRFAEPFAVVKDGKPAARIVWSGVNWWQDQFSSPLTQTAAEELQSLVRLLTGVTVPIERAERLKGDMPALIVGKSWFYPFRPMKQYNPYLTEEMCRTVKADLAALRGTDGFVIRRFGRNIHIYGAEEKGTLNGVYRLLENNTDLIFVRPNEELGTVFTPTPGRLDLVWGDGILDRPAMTTRGFWNIVHPRYWNANGGTTTLSMRWSDAQFYTRGGHNSSEFIPPAAKRPDLHGLVAGKRGDYGHMFCFSNPELPAVFTEGVLAYADTRAMPRMKGVYIGLDDTKNWCECENCRKPLALADGTRVTADDPAFMSTQWFLLLNGAADALWKTHPGKQIVTLAYFQTAEVPKCPVARNIEVGYCPYMRANDAAPIVMPENLHWLELLEAWAKKVPEKSRLYVRGYDGLGLEFPRPLGHVHARDWKRFAQYSCGIYHETAAQGSDAINKDGTPTVTSQTFDYSAIEFWVMSRLMWNPDADVEKLYKTFCYRAFHEAAKPMERFFGTIRRTWMRSGQQSSIGETGTSATKKYILDAGIEKTLNDCLDEALRVVVHPTSKKLIERVKARYDFFVAEVKNAKTSALNVPLVDRRADPGFDDGDWSTAAVIDRLYVPWEAKKGNDVEGKYPARIDLTHDAKALYLRATFWEDMAKIVSSPKENGGDEDVLGSKLEVFLGDNANPGAYYLLRIDNRGNVGDYRGFDGSWKRKGIKTTVRRDKDRWTVLLKVPLPEIGMDIIRDNRLKAAFIRLRETSEKNPNGTSKDADCTSWKFTNFHQPETFGTLTLQR